MDWIDDPTAANPLTVAEVTALRLGFRTRLLSANRPNELEGHLNKFIARNGVE